MSAEILNKRVPDSPEGNNTSREVRRTSLFHIFLDNGVITAEPSKNPLYGGLRPFSINVERAEEILLRLVQVDVFSSRPVSPENPQRTEKQGVGLFARAQRLLPQAEISFIVSDVLPLPLHQQVDRLLTPDDIRLTANPYHRFYYGGNTFPRAGESRGILEIGQPHQTYLERQLMHMAGNLQIPLTSQSATDVALIWGMGHEYGHAINDALQLIQIEGRVKEGGAHLSNAYYTVPSEMHDIVHREIAQDNELMQVVGNDADPDSLYAGLYNMTSERIASGFELLSLRHALRSEGLSSSETNAMVTEYGRTDRTIFEENVAILQYIRSKGMSIDTMGHALEALRRELGTRGHTAMLSHFPHLFGFKDLGYSKPLSQSQLQSYIERFGQNKPQDRGLWSSAII